MDSVPRRNLQKRVVELLSSTAAAARLESPVSFRGKGLVGDAQAWLAAHPEVVPVDPWWPELREQRID